MENQNPTNQQAISDYSPMAALGAELNALPTSGDTPSMSDALAQDSADGANLDAAAMAQEAADLQALIDQSAQELLSASGNKSDSFAPSSAAPDSQSAERQSDSTGDALGLIDVNAYESEEARDLAAQLNEEKTKNARARVALEDRLNHLELQMGNAAMAQARQGADLLVAATNAAVQEIQGEYGVSVKPEYLIELLRDPGHQHFFLSQIQVANQVTPKAVKSVFIRHHAEALQALPRKPSSAPPSPTTLQGNNAGARPAGARPATPMEELKRELASAGVIGQ